MKAGIARHEVLEKEVILSYINSFAILVKACEQCPYQYGCSFHVVFFVSEFKTSCICITLKTTGFLVSALFTMDWSSAVGKKLEFGRD